MDSSYYALNAFCESKLTNEPPERFQLLIEIPKRITDTYYLDNGEDINEILCYSPVTMFLNKTFADKIPNVRYKLYQPKKLTANALPMAIDPVYTTLDGIKLWHIK